MRTRYTCCRPSHQKRRKRWTQQPHRKTFTATSGQSAQHFSPLSCRDWYFVPFLRSVLMSWVLSNVGDFSAFHFVRDGLWCTLHFSGVVGRGYSVSFCPPSLHLHALTRYAALPTGAPRRVARTTRSTDTWFLSSILSPSSPVRHLSPSLRSCPWRPPLWFSCSLYRVDDIWSSACSPESKVEREAGPLVFGFWDMAVHYLAVWMDTFLTCKVFVFN